MTLDAKRRYRLTSLLYLLAWWFGVAACGGDVEYHGPRPRVFSQDELNQLVADGLEVETPQISAEELELKNPGLGNLCQRQAGHYDPRASLAHWATGLSLVAGSSDSPARWPVPVRISVLTRSRRSTSWSQHQPGGWLVWNGSWCLRQRLIDPRASLAHWATGLSLVAGSSDSPARWPVLAHDLVPGRSRVGT